MRRFMAFLAVLAVVAVGMSLATSAIAQTPTTMGGSTTTRAPGVATTPTTAARTTATTAKPATAPAQARTGARTDVEIGIAGAALLLGGALLFFGQPLRRRITA